MSEQSPRMAWTFPSREDDPWWDAFNDFVRAVDGSGFAHREDRSIIWSGGGTISWDVTTATFTWTDTINIYSPMSAKLMQIEAGSIGGALDPWADGEVVYVNLTRLALVNVAKSLVKANALPSNDDAMAFGVRIGDTIYLRTGISLGDGDTAEGVAPVPSAGGGGGSGKQTAAIIVGNEANGDTADICDILDPGDGSGIDLAIQLVNLPGPSRDIYIRPGTYDLALPGSPTACWVIPDGVKVRGASSSHTVISNRTGGDLSVFQVGDASAGVPFGGAGAELCDIGIYVPQTQTSGASTYPSVVWATNSKCRRVRVAFDDTQWEVPELLNKDVFAAFAFVGDSGEGSFSAEFYECFALGVVERLLTSNTFFGFFVQGDPKYPLCECTLDDCSAFYADVGYGCSDLSGPGGGFSPILSMRECIAEFIGGAGMFFYSGVPIGGPVDIDHCRVMTAGASDAGIEMDCPGSVTDCFVTDFMGPGQFATAGIAVWNSVVNGNRVTEWPVGIWSNGDNTITGNLVDGDIEPGYEDVVSGNRVSGGNINVAGSRTAVTGNTLEGSGSNIIIAAPYGDNVVSGNMVDVGDITIDGDDSLVIGNRVLQGNIDINGDNNKVSENMLVTGAVNDNGVGNVVSGNI